MPRENRKRGKKRRREDLAVEPIDHELDSPMDPSPMPERNPDESPFGYVDADVKAYFRTVDVQIRQWQDNKVGIEVDEGYNPTQGGFFQFIQLRD